MAHGLSGAVKSGLHKNYFKGWYFKCADREKTLAMIPAYHRQGGIETASLQIITDSMSVSLPFDKLVKDKKADSVILGGCRFSMGGINLDIDGKGCSAHGSLRFGKPLRLKYDIMGPFSCIPFMQCRHSVYSMYHRVDGTVFINGENYTFSGGRGYTEGDSGYSFPKEYLWTQCQTDDCSLMLSVAHIPFGPVSFTGVIGAIVTGGREYRIATYLGATADRPQCGAVTVRQGDYTFHARLVKNNSHPLLAPSGGEMSRIIHESASCTAQYSFKCGDNTILDFQSDRACFEFEY